MPLDPDVKKILSMIPKLELKGDLNEIRRVHDSFFGSGDKISMRTKDAVIKVRDGEIMGRFYYGGEENSPILVYYHGGGFVFGSVESYDGLVRLLAKESGMTVLSVGYRLAPEHKYPIPVNDAWDTLMWLRENHLGDSGKVCVAGDSAGGNLAAVVSQIDRDKDQGIVGCQCLIYPAVNMVDNSPSIREYGDGYFLTKDLMNWFGLAYFSSGREAIQPYASPAFGKLENLPSALVITAEYDPLRDQGETYHHMMREAGNESVLVRYMGMIHGFVSFYQLVRAGRDAISQVAGYVRAKMLKS
ncbi:alpha/beta hydrolase [Sulfolobales archaeon HS-7]|nr:alpha/beta hydrolase [Sulfolobales archaeon HS-7]